MRALITSWRRWLGPVLLVIVAFGFRSAHYRENYGHPDETITFEVVRYMRSSGDWDSNWAKAKLEPGFHYEQYNFASYLHATFGFYRLVKGIPALDEWRSRDGGFWVYRFFSVALATLAVMQTWWLARRVGGARVGLAAGAWVAVLPGLVQDAHYARPEAFVTVLTLAAVLLSLPRGRFSKWRVFGAAVVVGVAVACKISMLAMAWLPLVALIPVERGAAVGLGRWAWAAGLTLTGLMVGFAVGAPDAVAHLQIYARGVLYLTQQYAGLHPPHSPLLDETATGLLTRYYISTLGGLGLVAGLGGGVVLWWQRRRRECVALVGPVVLFAGYFCTRSVFFERNLSHLLPLWCVLAALGLAAGASWIERRCGVRAAWCLAALLALALVRPTDISLRLIKEFSGEPAKDRATQMEKLRLAHPSLAWRETDLLSSLPLEELRQHFKDAGGALLVRVIDYHDEWSTYHGPLLQAQFEAKLLATSPGAFADVESCTLHTYGSWTDRFYLITGVLKDAGAGK